MSQWKDLNGYPKISLMIDGDLKKMFVHKLLALAFIPNPENKPQINHINGIKDDNRLENLEWCTASENIDHSYRMGFRSAKGERNGFAKLTAKQVSEIRSLEGQMMQKDIAKMYNISPQNINGILRGRQWH